MKKTIVIFIILINILSTFAKAQNTDNATIKSNSNKKYYSDISLKLSFAEPEINPLEFLNLLKISHNSNLFSTLLPIYGLGYSFNFYNLQVRLSYMQAITMSLFCFSNK